MKLIDDWRAELARLWSVGLCVMSVIFGEAAQILDLLPAFTSYIPPGWYAVLSLVFGVGAILARVLKQKEKPSDS